MCASARTGKAKEKITPKNIEDAVQDPDFMLRMIEKHGQDAVIMAMGAYLGYYGLTPLTFLWNVFKGVEEAAEYFKWITKPGIFLLQDMIDDLTKSKEKGHPDTIEGTLEAIAYGQGQLKIAHENEDQSGIDFYSQQLTELYEHLALLEKARRVERTQRALMGSLEALALTRPGVLPAIMGMVPFT